MNRIFKKFFYPSEWTDADLNSETWEEPKVKKNLAGAGKTVKTNVSVPTVDTQYFYFDDPSPPTLPIYMREHVYDWKKPFDVFKDPDLIVYDPTNSWKQLTVPSPIVSDCDFVKLFKDTIKMLKYYGEKFGFVVEFESAKFVPTTQGEPWQPWHHVYGSCKAGKGQIHKPVYHPFGKYALRLFYFGTWRKIIVDDRIPCDKNGLCMLPVTEIEGELWPILLAKGILKIISQTCSLMDFSLVTCFTGWLPGNVNTANKTYDQIWRRFQILTPRYEPGPGKEKDNQTIVVESNKGSSKREGLKQQQAVVAAAAAAAAETIWKKFFCVVWADLGNFSLEDSNLNDTTVIFTTNRDSPLIKVDKREPTKPWKRLRWVYWAKKKGIWIDELSLPPYRRLQYITFSPDLSAMLAPDPCQECTLYAIPEGESETEEQQQQQQQPPSSIEGSETFQPLQWSDFYGVCKHLINVTAYLKPHTCENQYKISSLSDNVKKNNPSGKTATAATATAATTSKTPASQNKTENFYFYSPELTPTLNQPVTVYCESLTHIFIFFSLWVYPEKKKKLKGYLDPFQWEILKIGHASLLVEKYDWRNLHQGNLLGYAKTIDNSSICLNLKSGRHILKLWINSDSPYTLNVYSNARLFFHSGPKIRFLMSNESESVISYIGNVANAFISLTQKFGKSDLKTALKDFYKAIKPGNDSAVNYHSLQDKFIETFLNCLMLSLTNLIPSTDELRIMVGALRSLFLNPFIECDLPSGEPETIYGPVAKKSNKKNVVVPVIHRSLSQILSYTWTGEEIKKIIYIQKIFRGYRYRLLLKRQTPARKEFKPFAERLKKICDAVFSPVKRDLEVGKIIRLIAMTDKRLMDTFKFHKDFPNVLEVEEFYGKIPSADPYAWIPMARFIIATHASEPVPCAFYFSCNLEQYVVIGVNNDSNKELFSVANTVSPYYYYNNSKGYTILILGWNDANVKNVNWRLEMVRMKHFQEIHLCNTMSGLACHPYGMPSLEVSEVKNIYIPNSKSRMCRCLIKIQKRTILTFRLTSSFENAEFVVFISLDRRHCDETSEGVEKNSKLVECLSTNGAVLLPSLVLESAPLSNRFWNEADDDFTTYVLEAFTLNNSWPLTKNEWGTVEPVRVNGESWRETGSNTQLKKGASESRRKLTRTSKRCFQSRVMENPFWLLQVINDASESNPLDAVVVEEDKSYQESIKAMKISWEEKDPGRRKRGRDVRQRFLYQIYMAYNKDRNLEGEYYGERDYDFGERLGYEEKGEDFSKMFRKLSNFSYLTKDKSETRYLRSPRILPRMPTKDLLEKYELVQESLNSVRETRSTVSQDLTLTVSCKGVDEKEEENRREYLNTCNMYRDIMVKHFTEEQKISVKLIEQAFELRSRALQRMARCVMTSRA